MIAKIQARRASEWARGPEFKAHSLARRACIGWLMLLAVVIIGLASVSDCHAQKRSDKKRSALSNDQQTIDRYVKSGKYQLAEFFCREQLSKRDIALERRAAMTNELLRVYQQQASTLSENARASIWKKSATLIDDYLKKDTCLLYTSPSPRDKRQSRMPSSA